MEVGGNEDGRKMVTLMTIMYTYIVMQSIERMKGHIPVYYHVGSLNSMQMKIKPDSSQAHFKQYNEQVMLDLHLGHGHRRIYAHISVMQAML